jgi:formamidopyrimidine-DNA glycosylase
MPELPEVETTCRGITPHCLNQSVKKIIIRQAKLRWPIPQQIKKILPGERLNKIERRGKYILLHFNVGTLLIHLGMSGSLRILPIDALANKHNHFDMLFNNGLCLRFHDPRRFGSILFTKDDPYSHKLLANLGPEPLTNAFNSNYLFDVSRNKSVNIKQLIMNSKIVVGVGNIYASEALFLAGIHPRRSAGKISKQRYQRLTDAIKSVLTDAIKQGGTTLRDFTSSDGKPGYFSQQLNVYGREGQSCPQCGNLIKKIILAQRASYYCGKCQR